MRFGERLYELRKSKNLSQEELAELLNVSRQSISKWENDKAYPEMTRLLFLSNYFEVSLDYLMRGVENEDEVVLAEKQAKYRAKNLLLVWNTFVSNLTSTQRKMFIFLYILVVLTCIAIILAFVYGAGYEFGSFFYNVTH